MFIFALELDYSILKLQTSSHEITTRQFNSPYFIYLINFFYNLLSSETSGLVSILSGSHSRSI